MIESSSRRFIEMIDPYRDEIYARSCRLTPAGQSEVVLQKTIRAAFRFYVQNGEKLPRPPQDIVKWLEDFLKQQTDGASESASEMSGEPPAMPADTWARLAAAVQIEAAVLGGAAERSMLAYDPLLAPKKKSTGNDELIEGFGLDPWARFVIAAAIVLIFGIVATIMLMTHHTPLVPASRPAESEPAIVH
ncbi:MAG TPA: hypothetical protein VMG59_09985 [Phycisphaerae bacterium]|nr:hypothetical protein [Phycisphaerae bacterium]